ncbi:ABC transporter ATP-binding protein [Aestuariibacter salexigens]|uniref:ATP-binding cassette ATPase Uup n=1 Tax=Aestuariibacter salexigens TaxID=226010 RepID=UPI0004274F91|nr:ABC transporter ATP-binding protein [Aestuariibacter salexigens]
MSHIQLKNASILFGHPPLLDDVDLVIEAGERVCLVGRNGSGKSTLLKCLSAELALDAGQRIVSASTRIARLEQDPPDSVDVALFDYVAEGLKDAGEVLKDYFHQTQKVAKDPSQTNLAALQSLQEQLEHLNAWQFEQQIQRTLTKLGLTADQRLASLSGGWRRKAALARALVGDPDVLLLDEPTNHLDISMITWLECVLKDYSGAIVFISHDRAFIRKLATRIVDLDRGKLTSYPGNYAQYLQKKAEDLEIEAQQNAEFDKKLAKEEVWIRQGIKARRTRNEGRVRALKSLREEYRSRRNTVGDVNVTVSEAQRSGKRVFELDDVSYSIDGKRIIDHLNLLVQRGDKLALIGPNGCGKSTLIKLMLGELSADDGSSKQGHNLEIAYFDQHRQALDLEKTVIDTVGDGKRDLTVNGRPRHVISYLQDYLFSPERVNVPVKALSGGEKNRLLLAKLMLKPSNVLILDEPTNDLDVETLELLEEVLSDYPGTLILVSHDREFVDNVVTRSLFFTGHGKWVDIVGAFDEITHWQSQQQTTETFATKQSQKASASTRRSKKLSYKDQRELDRLPEKIEELELRLSELQETVNDPEFFKQNDDSTQQVLAELEQTENALNDAYQRWDQLESQLDEI